MRIVVPVIVLLCVGCGGGSSNVECRDSNDCGLKPGGLCEANPATGNRWCSYPCATDVNDAPCQSGRCWSDFDVGDDIGGTCQPYDPNTDATLSRLVLSEGDLAPVFAPTLTSYSAALPLSAETVTVTPTAAVPDGVTITVNGMVVDSGAASSPITLALGSNALTIVVTAEDSSFVTYDIDAARGPGVMQRAYVKASNTQYNDRFGSSVAIDGDTLVVGAPFEDSAALGVGGDDLNNSAADSGAVYVFIRNGDTWMQQAYIKAPNTEEADNFGGAVAIDGDVLVVGARNEDSGSTEVGGNQADNSVQDSGAAYVFRRTGTTWQPEAYLKSAHPLGRGNFGQSVAVDGDTIAIGAPGEHGTPPGTGCDEQAMEPCESGAVYVFARSGANWSLQADVRTNEAALFDHLGVSVAVQSDTLVAGASGANNQGKTYVFGRIGVSWSQQADLSASNPGFLDSFGGSVALDGDTLVVGAWGEDSGGTGVNGNGADDSADDAGAVYVFARNGNNWVQRAYIKASNTDAGDKFGQSVAVTGDLLIVGAPQEDSSARGVGGAQSDNGATESGAVYLFTRSEGEWRQRAYIKAANADAQDGFGSAVAVDGNTVVSGAPFENGGSTGVDGNADDNTTLTSGAVYVFR